MLKPFFEINFGQIPIYYIMMLFGFYLASNKLDVLLKREAYSNFMKRKVKSSLFIGAIIGLLGANVANWFLFDGLLERALTTRLTQGGFSFIFGLLTFLLFSVLLLRWRKVKVQKVMNLIVEPILIAHFWGRIGCSLRGCCWGETIILDGIEVMIPVREIEALCLLIMYWTIPRKIKENQLWVYLLSYSSIRFVLEFCRGDDRGCLLGITVLSPSQIVCALLCIISVVVLFLKPEMRFPKLMEKLDPIQRKFASYEALPDDYEEPQKKNIFTQIVMPIACVVVVVFALFVAINPFQSSWCINLQWKIDDLLSVFTTDRSSQDAMGEGSGTETIAITYEGAIDLGSGLNIISTANAWTGANYVPIGAADITDGAKLYYYLQTVNGRPVLGTARIIVADKDSCPEYMISDAASQTYTTKILDNYSTNGITLEETFGGKAKITDSMACWYDTGNGLIAVNHVIISYNGKVPVMGAVLQESNGKIICFTGPDLGVLDSAEKTKILFDSQTALMSLNTRKLAKNGSWIDIFNKKQNNTIDEGITEIIEAYDLSTAQVSSIIKSVNDIIRRKDTSNLSDFACLFEHETQRVLLSDGYDEEEVDNICEHIRRIFASNEDERALQIVAQERANKFKYRIHYYLDADVFNIVSQDNHSLDITIDTKYPIQAELYNREGVAITSIYVDAKETIKLYPEDGTDFVLKVKGCKTDNDISNGTYEITVKTKEQKEVIPIILQTTLYRIEKAYDQSDMISFMSLYRFEDYSIVEGMAMGALAPIMDSCASSLNNTTEVDTAKETIARLLLKNRTTSEMFDHLVGSNLSMTYISHIETEDGYLVRARAVISKGEVIVYNDIVRFRLQPMKADDIPEEMKGVQGLEFLSEVNYCITEVNTPEIFSAFGDDPNNAGVISDIVSIYEYVDKNETIDNIHGVEIKIRILKEKEALEAGHSKEKVDYMVRYIKRLNLSRYKQAKEIVESQIASAQVDKFLYEGGQWITDFGGTVLDKGLEAGDNLTDNLQENTDGIFFVEWIGAGLNATYDFIYGAYDEYSGLEDKIIGLDKIEEDIDDALERAKVLQDVVDEIDKRIRQLERDLE